MLVAGWSSRHLAAMGRRLFKTINSYLRFFPNKRVTRKMCGRFFARRASWNVRYVICEPKKWLRDRMRSSGRIALHPENRGFMTIFTRLEQWRERGAISSEQHTLLAGLACGEPF